jgi:hypothetical protein
LRDHPLSVEEFRDVSFLARHFELSRFLAENKTHEAVFAVGRTSTNAVLTTDGKFKTVCHVAPFVEVNNALPV